MQNDILKKIHQYDLFKELSLEELQLVFNELEYEKFKSGHHIINQGEYGEKAYFLVSGTAEAYVLNKSGEKVIVGILQEGGFFGELSLLLSSPRSNFVQAVTVCEAFSLTKDRLDQLLNQFPIITKAINKILSKRLSETLRIVSKKTENVIILMIASIAAQSRVDHFKNYFKTLVTKEIILLESPILESELLQKLNDIENSYIIIKAEVNPPAFLEQKSNYILNFNEKNEKHIFLSADQSVWHIEHAARRIAKKTIGIALCSGGAPAAAHIGVLNVLHNANIPFDYIVGTSAGAAIGFAYALGISMQKIREFVLEFVEKSYISKLLYTLPYIAVSGKGLIRASYLKRTIDIFLNGKEPELKIPFAAIASDLFSGETVVLKDNWIAAITASNAAPVFMEPVAYDTKLLIDGAATAPLPIKVLCEEGIDIKIGVPIPQLDLITPLTKKSKIFAIYMRSRSMMVERIMNQSIELADVIINPNVHGIHMDNWSQAPKVIAAGEAAASIALNRIKFLLHGSK